MTRTDSVTQNVHHLLETDAAARTSGCIHVENLRSKVTPSRSRL
jgi:hypothetical protein